MNGVLITHPNNGGELFGSMVAFNGQNMVISPAEKWNGIQIMYDKDVPARKTETKWAFPKDKFVEYEKSDEDWAIPLGFGKWETLDLGPIVFKLERNVMEEIDIEMINGDRITRYDATCNFRIKK